MLAVMKSEEKIARLRLIRTATIGPITFARLLQHFGTAARTIESVPQMMRQHGGRPIRIANRSVVEDEIATVEKSGGTILVYGEEGYPPLLAQMDDAPGCITVLGHHHLLEKKLIAMVGSRNATLNGRSFAKTLATELTRSGFCIVSGMARGIDTAAHEGSISGGTIAVLAGGVDHPYPEENIELYERIIEAGAVVSEMPLGMRPLAQHFPVRNRIIAALALGTVVVEANANSGSLITAREANERGREVMAVPGSPIDPRSRGCNTLIRQGATLVETAEHIAEALTMTQISAPPQESINTDLKPLPEFPPEDTARTHQLLKNMLSYDAIEVDELIRECHVSPALANIVLLYMELSGEITRHHGNKVSLLYKA